MTRRVRTRRFTITRRKRINGWLLRRNWCLESKGGRWFKYQRMSFMYSEVCLRTGSLQEYGVYICQRKDKTKSNAQRSFFTKRGKCLRRSASIKYTSLGISSFMWYLGVIRMLWVFITITWRNRSRTVFTTWRVCLWVSLKNLTPKLSKGTSFSVLMMLLLPEIINTLNLFIYILYFVTFDRLNFWVIGEKAAIWTECKL